MTISAILLQPGNRLLSGGTTDFAMFGGQPASVTVGAPSVGDAGTLTARSASTDMTDGTGAASSPHSFFAGSVPTSDPSNGASTDLGSGLTVSSSQPSSSATSDVAATDAGAPHGGSVNPFLAPVLSPTHHAGDGGAGDLAPASASTATFSSPLVDAGISDANGLLHTTVALAEASASQIDHLAGTTLDTVGALAGEALTLADATGGLVHDSLEATILPLVDHLASGNDLGNDLLAGTDPIGGIATLTSMVGSADVFEIAGHATSPLTDPVASTLDAVPEDGGLLSPLLGDHHTDDASHHDGLVDGHPVGIGGL